MTPAPLMLLGGLLHLARLSRWRSLDTLSVPLLWSLHLSYLFLALGLILWGLSYFSLSVPLTASTGIHMITVGTLGLMILAMMSRISLGHTGRMLEPKPIVSIAFLCLAVATICRSIMPIFGLPILAWYSSTVLWLISGAIFLFTYWPILSRARLTR